MGINMATVQLNDEEWQRVMACMSWAPWKDVNHLLMKMGEQLQQQHNPINKQQMQEVPAAQGEINVKHNG
jgi:hypothetical protein